MFQGDILSTNMLLSLRILGRVESRVVRDWVPSALSPPGARHSSHWLPDSPAVVPFTPHFGIITAGGEQEVRPHEFNYLKFSSYLDFAMGSEVGPVFVTSHLSRWNLKLHVAPRGMKSLHACRHQNTRQNCNWLFTNKDVTMASCVQGIHPKAPSELAVCTLVYFLTLFTIA
jgi:hypothetical protein